ncbi:MAG: S1C family serine protease [[Ruminococcus] torques]|mgnify:CR=1 FL=1|uniref:S1C family serine protease n=1 Tax=Dorea formicigenerans TaxID=39486 RepID=UPI0008222C09|nr:S1C family serine protease [uncultured Dorea sp.]SCG96554.1 Putative serine protease HhoB precursor [uncultured Dorea sp.]
MKDEKEPLEQKQNSEEEEYSFLQEIIKDEAGDQAKWKHDVLRRIQLGLIFGLVACFTFFACKPWVEKRFEGDPTEVTIPQDEQQEENQTQQEEEQVQEQKTVLTTETYQEMLNNLKQVSGEVRKSVVEIQGAVTEEEFSKDQEDKEKSISGMIVADNGQELLILAGELPVKDAKIIRVTFSGDSQCDAILKSRDAGLGLCVYAVQRKNIADDVWAQIETATLGGSKVVSEGDTVIAVGKLYGCDTIAGYGVIESGENYLDKADGQYQTIYTDVAGDISGSGVLVNIRGEVIGIINTSVRTDDQTNKISGYGISDIKDVIELLSNGKNVPYLGVSGVEVSSEMQGQGIPQGVYVKEVDAGSPAMAAGIQSGDIITNIADTDIINLLGYHNTLMKQNVGDKILVRGKRQGTGGEYVDIDFGVTVGYKQ